MSVIVVTIENQGDGKVSAPSGVPVIVQLTNGQTSTRGLVSLRPGERVLHHLRIDPQGTIKLELQGESGQ